MRGFAFLCALVPAFALASDHNNVDAGRPLSFDDARSLGFRERVYELGLGGSFARGSQTEYVTSAELRTGYAMNRDIGIGLHATHRPGLSDWRAGRVEIKYFESLSRETLSRPATAWTVSVGLPSSDEDGVEARLRGIMSRAAGQYDKLHLNVDLTVLSEPEPGERSQRLGAILGYSRPLGYPTMFDTTLVAEVGAEQEAQSGGGIRSWLGVGFRRQVTKDGVLDGGVQADVLSDRSRKSFRISIGYSASF